MNMNRRTDAECGKNCRKTEKCCMQHRSVLAAEPAPWPRVSALFLRRASRSSHSALNTRTRGMKLYYLVRTIVRKIVTPVMKLH